MISPPDNFQDLPDPNPYGDEGLIHKYTVIKNSDMSFVEDCFVLRPLNDPSARIALNAYAEAVSQYNEKLSRDLLEWMKRIEHESPARPKSGSY